MGGCWPQGQEERLNCPQQREDCLQDGCQGDLSRAWTDLEIVTSTWQF